MRYFSGTIRPILITTLLLASNAAWAQALEVEITDWGLSAARVIGHEPAPGTSAGYSARIDNRADPPLERTDIIDACPGTQFGIKYRLKNAGPASLEEMEIEWTHPRFHLTDGRATTTDRFPAIALATPVLNGWFFEEAYELVSGEWIVSIQRDGETLAQHRFTVRVVRDCARLSS